MIFNMVGGGAGGAGGGATLVVSSPANVSVTVSKDDKSYTKNSGSLGSTTFKGLATGIWTVIISGNGQTATKTIEITADYAITIAFFYATINITYPANSVCVVTNSIGQTVASDTNTGASAKTWTATVNAEGTYTITATDDSGNSASVTVSITSDGQSINRELSYVLVLFDNGDNTQETDGFSVFGKCEVTATEIQLTKSQDKGAGFSTNKKIDISKYSVLEFHNTVTSGWETLSYRLGFGVTNEKITNGVWSSQSSKFSASARPTEALEIISVPIENIDSGYIAAAGYGVSTITKIVLR